MNDDQKKQDLRKFKTFATALFLLMVVIFAASTILQKSYENHWLGYIRAFSEAAMVGALADWFAVTALFHHPLGLKIPHTNLIEKSKEKIGDNLGDFVVSNFLSPKNIKPYILKLKISSLAGDWLSKERNQEILMTQITAIILDILHKLDDETVVQFIKSKAIEMTEDFKVNQLLGKGLDYILERDDHQKLITKFATLIKNYILENQDLVQSRVKKESFTLIPKFVDDALAKKITNGLSKYFEEIEQSEQHPLRHEITQKLFQFSSELSINEKWETELQMVKNNFLKDDKMQEYAANIWISIKNTAKKELEEKNSTLKIYVKKNIETFAENLKTDLQLQQKIDQWIRVTAYKYILKNTHQFGELISGTVGNWKGRELSEKLELEVGKDLQFIRVNGTLVGGLVGLIIYTITEFFL